MLRGILVRAGHVAWTGALCAALWHLVETSHTGRGVLALGAAYVGAIVMHTAWDAISGVVLHVGIGVVSVAVLLWLILAAHRAHVRRPAPSAADPSPGSAPDARTA